MSYLLKTCRILALSVLLWHMTANAEVSSTRSAASTELFDVFPRDKAWPSKDTWGLFNGLLNGTLLSTVPIAAPCYGNWESYNRGRCERIGKSFTDPYFFFTSSENDQNSIMFPLFQGGTCLPIDNPNGYCAIGGYPVYTVNVSTVAQIQLAVNFARNANLRLVVKNTGHCYLGKSSGAGALSVWTHNLKDIRHIEKYEAGAYQGKAMNIGACVTVGEVYSAAHEARVTAVGGNCESVGYAGGYIAGGGHSPLSNLHGMAADHVLALELMTASGQFITASSTSNPELFWALRGGGGSTFGIVTSIIIRVHRRLPVTTSFFSFSTSEKISEDIFWAGVRAYFGMFIPFTYAGTSSYSWIYRNKNKASYTFEMKPFFAPNHLLTEFAPLTKTLFDQLTRLGISPLRQTWHDEHVGTWTSRSGNRLFPRSSWEDPVKFNKTFEMLRRHSEKGYMFGGYHMAPNNNPFNVDNAVNPAFRNAIAFLVTMTSWATNSTESQIKEISENFTNEVMKLWRDIAPVSEGGGSYLNEAVVNEPEWQESFYGSNYKRLGEIKRKWDPEGVFYATTGVGSEDWDLRNEDQVVTTQNGRLCHV
ncbi:hypothetical protein BJ875DRAFT_529554 [Amylocarpus encephaloides]|uniref:FAD-binding PCMH-type domain-containing protein n=1 Tax=Amylocarpus encephaloides TaxID=45428 RepID=A0A9P7YKK1_9HELO|nr:hypothetical protein BJ875DRAFT_529554 [Amylocarpus encephaloides]